jgi:hypothetical protein
MFIAHLPAGYIVSKFLLNKNNVPKVDHKAFLIAGMLGAVFPDIDMLYFYLLDNRQHHHHQYFTHYPIVWLTLLMVALVWKILKPDSIKSLFLMFFAFNAFIHLCLDTIVGDIWWLAPFVDQPFSLFTVPALYHPWWLNFFLHWSFALEVSICLWAIVFWHRQRDFH